MSYIKRLLEDQIPEPTEHLDDSYHYQQWEQEQKTDKIHQELSAEHQGRINQQTFQNHRNHA